MILTLLTKQELSLRNKRTLKYNLMAAEKDYFLAVVSKIIYDSSLIKPFLPCNSSDDDGFPNMVMIRPMSDKGSRMCSCFVGDWA